MSNNEMPNPKHVGQVFAAIEQLGYDPAEAASNPVLAKFMSEMFRLAVSRDVQLAAVAEEVEEHWTALEAEMSAAKEIDEYSVYLVYLDAEHEKELFLMHAADTVEEVLYELENAEE